MSKEENKIFFGGVILSWLFGYNNEEAIINYIQSKSDEEIDRMIDIIKNEAPVEEKYKEATINKINEIRNNREKGGEK